VGVCGISSFGQFEVMAMRASAIIMNEVHGHNYSTIIVPCVLV
jgi:hypothetical protein